VDVHCFARQAYAWYREWSRSALRPG
jgi:hypothetical protein